MGKVISLRGHAAGRDVNATSGPENNVRIISGGTNIIGNQGDVTIQIVPRRRSGPRFVVQPDAELNITQAQIIALREIRNEWIELHGKLKQSPLTYASAQAAINKAAGAASQALIRKDRYDDAVAFVKQKMAILSNMKSAPRKDDDWRVKRIGAIKARCKNQFGGVDVYKPYIKKNFQATSLADLATDELQKTYAYVMAKKADRP